MKKLIILYICLSFFAEAQNNKEFIKGQLELTSKLLEVSEEQLNSLEGEHNEKVKNAKINSFITAFFILACKVKFKTNEAYLCGVPTGIPAVVYGAESNFDTFSQVQREIKRLKLEIIELQSQLVQQ